MAGSRWISGIDQGQRSKGNSHGYNAQSVCHEGAGVKYFVHGGLKLVARHLKLIVCPLVGRPVRFCTALAMATTWQHRAHAIAATTAVASSWSRPPAKAPTSLKIVSTIDCASR